MHYGRIYIQYFALWSSHWSGGLIVCVFVVCLCVSVCYNNRNTLPTLSVHQFNGISVCQRVSNDPSLLFFK